MINSTVNNSIIEIVTDINNSLNSLKELSLITKFKIASERKDFLDKTVDIKNKYMQIESLLKDKVINKFTPPAMRMYISRNIHPQQMEGWVTKLQINSSEFLRKVSNNILEINDQVSFIEVQYILLDTVIKVLNGDAHFVGCLHTTKS